MTEPVSTDPKPIEAGPIQTGPTEGRPHEPASTDPIHKIGTTASGMTVSAGYHAVGPDGQLVLLRPDTPLKSGWRLATQDDLAAAERLESARAAKDKSGEREDRSEQSARYDAKRADTDAAGQTLTVSDEELAKAHARGEIKHPWPGRQTVEPAKPVTKGKHT
jgi:hypothetical protein